MQRALIVKLGAIGDVVMALPAVHALSQQGFQIDWVASHQAAAVLQLYPFVRVIEADERVILQGAPLAKLSALRSVWKQLTGPYDLVAALYYDWRYRLLSLPVRTSRHVQLSHEDRAVRLLPGRHHTDEFARILLGSVSLHAADGGPEPTSLSPLAPVGLPVSPLPPPSGTRVVLAAGGAKNLLRDDLLRRWPVESYAALGRMLVAAGHEVVLTGGPGDTWVRKAFEGMPCTDLIDRLSLPQLLAVFDGSDAVVTHDSGPLHLAGVTSCALLGIFGPVDPRMRLPRRPGAMALWGGESFACRPCYDGSRYANCSDNQCMAEITPGLAFDALKELLNREQSGEPAAFEVRAPVLQGSLISIGGVAEPA
ncbi:MAG: glycosyltransferase family 9 protein [Janthinobacterium lividum]